MQSPLIEENRAESVSQALQKSRSKKALGLAPFCADAHLSRDKRKDQAEAGDTEKAILIS